MSRSLRASLVVVVALVWLAPAASAQEDGVFVDPESPTGKEYAIPLESARRQADPSGGRPGSAPGTAPLFGAGIVTSAGGREADVPAAATGSGSRATQGQAPAAGTADAASSSAGSSDTESVVREAKLNPGAPAGGLGTPLVVALLALGLLLAGSLAGVAIRRTRG